MTDNYDIVVCETFSREIEQSNVTKSDLIELLTNKPISLPPGKTKSDIPALIPASLKSDALDSRRVSANVESISLLILDYDTCSASDYEILSEWLAPFQHVIYSSYSHESIENPKFRVVLFPDEPIPAKNWGIVWNSLVAQSPVSPDLQAKDPIRMYYLPIYSRYPGAAFSVDNHDIGIPYPVSELLQSSIPQSLQITETERTVSITQNDLIQLSKKLAKSSPGAPTTPWVLAASLGRPLATPTSGERHNRTVALSQRLAFEFPNATAKSLAEVLYLSITKHVEQDAKLDMLFELKALSTACESACEKADAEMLAQMRNALDAATSRLHSKYGPDAKFETEASLKLWAEELGLPVQEDYRQYLILTTPNGQSYYIRTPLGYKGPFGKSALTTATRECLGDYAIDLYSPTYITQGGMRQYKVPTQLVDEYASTMSHMELIWTIDKSASRFDEYTQTIIVSRPLRSCAIPNLPEAPHPLLLEWLDLFSGGKLQELFLWIRRFSDLTRPAALLYLTGDPGTGKNLFSLGLANYFGRHGPILAAAYMKKYCDHTASPLVFADEGVPTEWTGYVGMKNLKADISQSSRDYEVKFMSPEKIIGHYRFVAASNDDDLLQFDRTLTSGTRQALQQRILRIESDPKAAAFLESLTGNELIALREKHIPEFVRWVASEAGEGFESDHRFANPNYLEDKTVERQLSYGDSLTASILQWVVSWLENPDKLSQPPSKKDSPHVLVYKKIVHVQRQCFLDADLWDVYLSNANKMRAGREVTNALQNLSSRNTNCYTASGRVQLGDTKAHQFKKTRYYKLDPQQLQHAASMLSIEPEDLEDWLGSDEDGLVSEEDEV